MPINRMTFPMLNWQQTNPALYGVQQGVTTIGDILANQHAKQLMQAQAIQNQYLQPTEEEALKQQQLKTQIMQPQAQYAPETILAALQESQARVPYMQAQANLMGEQAKYYPQNMQSQLANAAIARKLQEMQISDPLLFKSGVAGQIGALTYMQRHPDIYGNIPVGGVATGGNINVPTAQNNASLADILHQSILSTEDQKAARTDYYKKMANTMDYRSLPIDQKSALLAQASGMGYDPNEATSLFMQGNNIRDLAKQAGFDPENMPDPIYPATRNDIMRMNQRKTALQEINYLNPIISDALAPYSRRILGYSPKQISEALSGTDEDAQAKFLAAKALMPELSSLRLKAMGGQIGIEAIREVTNSSMGHLKAYQGLVSPEIYKEANNLIDTWITSAAQRANTAITKGLSQQEQARNMAVPQTGSQPQSNDPLGLLQ